MNGRKTNHQLQRLLLTAATTVFVFFAHQKFPLREKIILLLQFDAFFCFYLSVCMKLHFGAIHEQRSKNF